MEKMVYEQPSTEVFELTTESVILNNSPGDPGQPGGTVPDPYDGGDD